MIRKLLTRRETEIAKLVAAGLSNKQIARKASISEATVKIHLHNAHKSSASQIAARSPSSSAQVFCPRATRKRARGFVRADVRHWRKPAHNHRRPERPPSTRC